ncbi:MAG: hypothetical protein IPH13_00395 [Planctomycetes bacterium]|nr:hypothetical protein [Planctomycetota bacterium]
MLVFGEPTFSVNPLYLKAKLGYVPSFAESNGTTLLTLAKPALATVVNAWLGIAKGNVRFVAEQSAVWLALLAPLSVVGAWFALRPRSDRSTFGLLERRLLVLVVLSHLAIMLVWPLCKFRYLIPWFPPLILLAVSAIDQLRSRRPWLVGLAVGPFLALQVVLVIVSGTLTTYDDGILARDATGKRGGEIADRAKQQQLRSAVIAIAALGVEGVVADIELAIHAREMGLSTRVVQAPTVGRDLLAAVVRRVQKVHGVTHILALSTEEALLYGSELGAIEVFSSDDASVPTVLMRLP